MRLLIFDNCLLVDLRCLRHLAIISMKYLVPDHPKRCPKLFDSLLTHCDIIYVNDSIKISECFSQIPIFEMHLIKQTTNMEVVVF